MRTHRKLRMASVIREELAKLLLREAEFEHALVTITNVEVDDHYIWADVYVSVLPKEKAPAAMAELDAKTGHLHHLLNRIMNIRPMPRIRFKPDRGTENAAEIEKIFLNENNKDTA